MKYKNNCNVKKRLVRDRIDKVSFHTEDGEIFEIEDVFYFDVKTKSDVTMVMVKFPLSPTYYFNCDFTIGQKFTKMVVTSVEYEIEDASEPIFVVHEYEGNFVVEFLHELSINDGEHYDIGMDLTMVENMAINV